MEPQVRYAQSADGTRIALSMLGRGQPLVILPGIWFTSMEANWQIPIFRQGIERLAEHRMVVRYDNRGQGLSGREVNDFSLEARVADLAAVVDHLGGSAVDLHGGLIAGTIAVAYAVANPEKVRRLILANAPVRGRDFRTTQTHRRLLRHAIEQDWPLYVRTITMVEVGWTEHGRTVAEASIDSITPETFLASQRAARDYDVADLLPHVRCPTLVIFRRGEEIASIDAAKQLAADIPQARLMFYEQDQRFLGEETVRIIEKFLDEDVRGPTDQLFPSGTAVILFADIADSTALTERLGDAAFRAKARDLGPALRALVRDCGGTPVEGPTLGDGVLAVFTSAREGIEAARRCAKAGDDAGLPLHLGLHAGDVTREKDPDGRDNVYGGAVNIASRISGLSAPGEVLVSETVRSLARTSAGVAFEDRGEQSLKGVGETVRVWAVGEGE